jgi:hypothetical protein
MKAKLNGKKVDITRYLVKAGVSHYGSTVRGRFNKSNKHKVPGFQSGQFKKNYSTGIDEFNRPRGEEPPTQRDRSRRRRRPTRFRRFGMGAEQKRRRNHHDSGLRPQRKFRLDGRGFETVRQKFRRRG